MNASVPRLSLTKRLLLLALPVAFFASWWATAHWGVAAVERHVLEEHVFMRHLATDPDWKDHYVPPERYHRLTDQQWQTGEGVEVGETFYYMKTYSPFPFVIRCEYATRSKGARALHFWFFRWILSGNEYSMRIS